VGGISHFPDLPEMCGCKAAVDRSGCARFGQVIAGCCPAVFTMDKCWSLLAERMMNLSNWVFCAGVGQLLLVAVSLIIPRVLRWSEDVAQLRPLTRQVFWTYAAYIWSTNLFFGVVSVTLSEELVSGSSVALALSTFIAIYWAARVGIQFFYFDRSDAPRGAIFVAGEWLLVGLFVTLTAVYGYAAWVNLGGVL